MAAIDPVIQQIGFYLLPNFALMSYASATEPLRAANLLAGREIYRARMFSLDGAAVLSSGGATIACEPLAEAGADLHIMFICAGGNPAEWVIGERQFAVLRRLARSGVRIGGISSGAYVMAAAGLLTDRDFTIHWEHAPALREAFPDLEPRQARYVIDGDRITCGGGVAPLDMMRDLIGARMGAAFALRVSDWYLHTTVGAPAAPQRASSAERFGTRHPALLAALEKMEATIEQPLDRDAMARFVGLSPRHLDRLFAQELGTSYANRYRDIRLDHAMRLLRQSPLSLGEIALAAGFSSPPHFSRAFRTRFGAAPAALRASLKASD